MARPERKEIMERFSPARTSREREQGSGRWCCLSPWEVFSLRRMKPEATWFDLTAETALVKASE